MRRSCLRRTKAGMECECYPLNALSVAPVSGLDKQEELYFQNFINNVTLFFGSRSKYKIQAFMRTMLQESITNSCVRHTIVATGAMMQSFNLSCKWAYMLKFTSIRDEHYKFALEQYQKAIFKLQTLIGGRQGSDDTAEFLIPAFALALFDIFAGNNEFAIQHIYFCRHVLVACHSSFVSTPCSNGQSVFGPLVGSSVASIFVNNDIQVIFALGIEEQCSYSAYAPPYSTTTVPEKFLDLEDARSCRDILLENAYNTYLSTLQFHFTAREEIPEKWMGVREDILQSINLWFTAFNSLQGYQDDITAHPLARSNSMSFEVTILLLRLSSMLQTPETCYDGLEQHFRKLLTVCNDVVEYECANSIYAVGTKSFNFEEGIIPALYLCATKCRISKLRNEAVGMLLAEQRREGPWDSKLHGRVARWLISLERESPATSDGRVWGECIQFKLESRKATVTCRQNTPATHGGGWSEKTCSIDLDSD
ncbi:hypothetical protein B0O99DRAFT_634396 [Bisporella sp. PMI_857]|nr:hypothetical protein B0O99DRAFT_634396 [Bisporella sp. PMI_857]